jgi:hypothetical protein
MMPSDNPPNVLIYLGDDLSNQYNVPQWLPFYKNKYTRTHKGL